MSVAELVPSYLQAFALVTAGVWTYWTFFRQRRNEPATDIDVDVSFLGTQDGFIVVEVTAVLENKSLVRQEYRDFRVNLRYLLPCDPIIDGGSTLFSELYFPHSVDQRIGGEQRFFPNALYINPRQRFQHRYETFIPCEATFVRLHCGFTLVKARGGRRTKGHDGSPLILKLDSQRVFPVPNEGNPRGSHPAGEIIPHPGLRPA
jgi:hypothetical protein